MHAFYFLLWNIPHAGVCVCVLAWQAVDEETKKMYAMSAALRRICAPKSASGRLEVSPEIYRQWKSGGSQRKALLNTLIKCNGDKDCFV